MGKLVRVIGIDVSTTKIAIVALYKKRFSVVELISNLSTWEERLSDLQVQFSHFVKSRLQPGDQVFIEEISFVQNKQILIKLVHFLALCQITLVSHGYPCIYVHNMTWKKGVGLKGRITKKEIRERAIELFEEDRIEPLSQDAVDALCIAHYGRLTLE